MEHAAGGASVAPAPEGRVPVGLTSLAIFMVVVLSQVAAFILTWRSVAPGHATLLVGLAALGGITMSMAGAGLGSVGALRGGRGRGRALAAAGFALNALCIVVLAVMMP